MMPDRQTRFEEVYDAYSGLILAYAARRTPNVHDAYDIVSETFAVAWRRLDDMPPGEAARPWLYAVARRVLANHRRSTGRRGRLDLKVANTFELFMEDSPSAEEISPHIAEAFSKLSAKDREILTLVGWDELDHEEIAVVLGCSRATVRVRLHRARNRFATLLDLAGMKRPTQSGHVAPRWATAHLDPEDS